MNAVRGQKRASRRHRTITYLGIGVAAMLCISVMSSTLIQRMGVNEDDLIILTEQKAPTYDGATDGTINPSVSSDAESEDVQDRLEDAAGNLADQLASAAPEEPEHTYATDHPDGFVETTTAATTTAVITKPATYDTTATPAGTLPLPETTAEYPEEDSTEKAGNVTGAPADVVPEEPEWTASEETTAAPAQTNAVPNYTMAVETEAVQDVPKAEGVQHPSSQGKPDYSLTTTAPSSSFIIYNVWTWKDADVTHT